MIGTIGTDRYDRYDRYDIYKYARLKRALDVIVYTSKQGSKNTK